MNANLLDLEKMLQNASLLAIVAVHGAENELSEVRRVHGSFRLPPDDELAGRVRGTFCAASRPVGPRSFFPVSFEDLRKNRVAKIGGYVDRERIFATENSSLHYRLYRLDSASFLDSP